MTTKVSDPSLTSLYSHIFENNGTFTFKACSMLQEFNFTDDEIRNIMDFIYSMRNDKNEDTCYCNGTMRNIATNYRNAHGYVSLFVCIFGTLANSINIAVLTRREMKSAPFAYILTWLAITDMILMVEYIPFTLYMYMISQCRSTRFSYTGAFYILIHGHLSQVLHTISICLTLTLAFWRHNAIRYPEKCTTLWDKEKCSTAVKVSILLPVAMCAPSYLIFGVQSKVVYEKRECHVLYYLDLSDIAKSHNELYIINLWFYAVVIKLLPCVILVVISMALIKALHNTTKRKQKLQSITSNLNSKNVKIIKSRRRADRSSHMLIAILFLFLMTEFPQCILGLLSGVLGQCFFKKCYSLFGEIMDILALLNGAINFVLYCAMSKQFRAAFMQLFHYIYIFKPANKNEFHI